MGSNNSITSPTDVPSLIVKQPEAEDSNEGGYKTELEEDSNEVATTSDPGHDYGASTEDDANNTDKEKKEKRGKKAHKDEKDLLGFLLESKKNEKESKMDKEYIIHDYDAGTEDDANKTDKEKKDKKHRKH